MAEWTSSLLLQSLGWATLNSFWQFALLWCFYLIANHYFRLSSNHRYSLAVFSILSGLTWFIYTFIDFYLGNRSGSTLFEMGTIETGTVLPKILTAASVAYLTLLIFPAFRLFRNWNYIQKIKKQGLSKAALTQRLFVQKISAQLGITKKVMVYVSSIVKSPVTVGYLKPIILLPLASFNNLSLEQTEAILLHELSHIRRSDYLVNLLLTVVHSILYFNPFVKFLIDKAEQERENCCDELVLQFQYDKLSYASALLQLERSARDISVLALGAAHKNHLLGRIEKIVGIAKKPSFERVRFAGAFLFLLIFLAANTMMLSGSKKFESISLDPLTNHFSFFTNQDDIQATHEDETSPIEVLTQDKKTELIPTVALTAEVNLQQEDNILMVDEVPPPAPSPFMYASLSIPQEAVMLSQEQSQQIYTTLADTRKVLEATQWKEVEKEIADGLTKYEKEAARQIYQAELDKLNWKQLEQKLKSSYELVDWERVNGQLKEALTQVKADSIRKVESTKLKELCTIQTTLTTNCVTAMPDVSIKQVQAANKAGASSQCTTGTESTGAEAEESEANR
jgi:bla regulator protein blaR1